MNTRVSMFHKALVEARAAGDAVRVQSLETALAEELGRHGYTLDDYYGDDAGARERRDAEGA